MKGEQDPNQKQPMKGEQDPNQKQPMKGEQDPNQKQPMKGEQDPNQKQPMKGEQDPNQKQPMKGEQDPDQKQPMKGEQDPNQKQPMKGEQDPNQKEPQKQLTPQERKEAEDAAKKAEELAEALKKSGRHEPTLDPKERGNGELPPSKPDQANPEHAAKATDLMLDSFREKMKRGEIDKDVLKQMKWTEEDARKFLDQHQRLKDQGVLDQVRGQGRGKTSGVGRNATEVRSQRDLNIDPSLLPPPELRSAWENLTRKRAEPPK
jgi:hypothetical protein